MTETVLVLTGIAVLLLAGMSILCIVQVWRTAKEMAVTFRTINGHLPVIMKNLEEMTIGANRTAAEIHRQVEDLSLLTKKMRGLLVLLVGIEEVIRRKVSLPYAPALKTGVAVSKGVRAFFSQLLGDRRPVG
ncbi:MAG: hypothetical protein AB1558_02205 [Thermodesulfobacteriota bacterium]